MEQLNSVTDQLRNSMARRRPWGQALLLLDCSALLSGPVAFAGPCSALHSGLVRCLQCFIFGVGKPVFHGKGKCTPWVKGELTYADRSLHPWFWLVCSHLNEASKSHRLVEKALFWLVEWSCSDCQWRWWWEHSCTSPIGEGKPQPYGLKYNARNSFLRAGLMAGACCRQFSTVAGSWVQASPYSAVGMRGPCVEMAARVWISNLSSYHRENFFFLFSFL